jgi:hypothetical protein
VDESLAGMEFISRAFDKLPRWGQVVFIVVTVFASIYCVAKYGFFSLLLHVIFSP